MMVVMRPVDTPGFQTWRPVAGFEDRYWVSDLGSVWSAMRGGIVLRPRREKRGYLSIGLWRNQAVRRRKVHLLVAEAFHGPRPDGLECRHLDGDYRNNLATNLAWGTHSENIQDSIKQGRNWERSKAHCPQGHPYDEENTYVTPAGHRQCRACRKVADETYRANRRRR